MGNTVNLSGAIVAGPLGAGDCVPNGAYTAPLSASKSAAAMMSGAPTVNSPSAFVTLPGVGAGGLVTRGDFLFVRSQSKIILRLTTVGDSGDVLSVIYLQGTFIQQFPDSNYLKLLEAQGVGAIEFLVTGNQ